MTAPIEREFVVFPRGYVREIILANLREGWRELNDPETGEPVTEDVIRRATQPGSRFFCEADAIDLACLGQGKRSEFLAQQISHDRAGTEFLKKRHLPLWGEDYLPGFSSSGEVLATGTPGTTWVGSTDVPDELATYGTDPAGNRYQVYISGVADADGEATLTLVSIDTGDEVNIEVGTDIRWANPPIGSTAKAVVVDNDFSGGSPPEKDAEVSDRLGSRIRHKPAAGNDAQFRAWAREASVSVEDAFVYPSAFHAGSVLVCVVQKRGSSISLQARIAGTAVLAAVTSYIVPPGSPVVPPGAGSVLVVAAQPRTTDVVLLLSLLKGSDVGWADAEPFPESRGALDAVEITTLTSQVNFRVTAGSAGQLPGGAAGPLAGVSLMVWDPATAAFVELDVNTVEDLGAGVYHVLLNTPPTKTLALGDYVSPLTERHEAITAGAVAYFDSLGPGEVVNTTDVRSVTAFRRPRPNEEKPSRAGQSITQFVSEAMGSALADSTLDRISVTTPTVPSDPSDGPELIVLSKFAVYPLD